ncbi:hypothetical protein [Sphingomonas sp. Sph1(2015)]|jgi:hypothetical protein|uniref:hypothetical protein n=1 Tax=Sphingomonas sp. Sph1(2015) TaxID=1628084 RepID=UPI001300CCAA|nr:hypothetical protein [Sphingomonas sp. Sph1(2015)]
MMALLNGFTNAVESVAHGDRAMIVALAGDHAAKHVRRTRPTTELALADWLSQGP